MLECMCARVYVRCACAVRASLIFLMICTWCFIMMQQCMCRQRSPATMACVFFLVRYRPGSSQLCFCEIRIFMRSQGKPKTLNIRAPWPSFSLLTGYDAHVYTMRSVCVHVEPKQVRTFWFWCEYISLAATHANNRYAKPSTTMPCTIIYYAHQTKSCHVTM